MARRTRSSTRAIRKRPVRTHVAVHPGDLPPSSRLRKLAAALRKFATSFPAAHEDYPWGERVVKAANGKIFVFLGDPYMLNGQLTFTVKLPRSRRAVLKLPFAKPCGYGLGKHGWVSVRLNSRSPIPSISTMKSWIKESHQAVAE